jgi:FkbH-like protein
LALEQLAEGFADVHVVDVAAALAARGAERLVDDGLVSFTHFGSPGWMLQRPEREKAAVHGIAPDPAALAELVGGDPYAREAVVACAHMDALAVVLGIGRKKCVIVDLDGTLWPGVLAETGAPFAWRPEISGPFSYIGLWFGIHEALRALRQRGIVLACVSKNDEATVRELWKYPEHYPVNRLIRPEDFVTWRVNWNDKSDNIISIAEELGFALDAFVFVDDNPVERERVRQRIPEITLMGDDLFSLRRRLLSEPGLQLPRITVEAASRTELVKAQLGRARMRSEMVSESTFVASLEVRCEIERLTTHGADVERLQELFQRTTQFNTTGCKFSVGDLSGLLSRADAAVFTLRVRDRFGDHGLVGGAVVVAGEIVGFVMSCRVIGLGVEHRFMAQILDTLAADRDTLAARIIETSRNAAARHLYRDNGFTLGDDGIWHLDLASRRAAKAPQAAAE